MTSLRTTLLAAIPTILASSLLLTAPWVAIASSTANELPPIQQLRVFPEHIELDDGRDRQSVVIQATLEDGTTVDVTKDAFLAIADATRARVTGTTVLPREDGVTELRVDYGGRSASVPVTIDAAADQPPISFRLDVMPALTASGCNTGTCHGAARGQDGFRLSLFGFDAAGDYHRITREQVGRRVNLGLPAQSLLIEKALGRVPHTGGGPMSTEEPRLSTLLEWIHSGAPDDPPDVARPVALEILPQTTALRRKGATQQMLVIARYTDGSTRDVTDLSAFLSSDSTCAQVDEHGMVSAGARGEAQITARFATFVVGAPLIVLDDDAAEQPIGRTAANYIDEQVFDKLRRLRIPASPICDDATFVRRAYLDVVGLLPTPAEQRAFLDDPSPDKRATLFDALLERKEFTELWVMKWSELLQIRTDLTRNVSYKSMVLYANWLRERIASNVPIDEIVRDLLASSGGTFQTPATNFYQVESDTLKLSENVAQVMLGTRIQCAQCHNHPFDRWTMDDYYGFASFFSQVGRKQAQDPREYVIYDSGSGAVKHPVTGQEMPPKFLGGPVADVAGRDRRAALAEWITADDNPYFARNLANLIWAHFFGRGIIEPVDDARVTNPPSHPALLDELARRLKDYDYDFRRLVRDIGRSTTYQLSSQALDGNAGDDRNYSHAAVRRLRAEILIDAIAQVTETKNKFQGLPEGARAVQISDGAISDYFLTTFGRAARTTVCSCEVQMEPNLSQALHLINGDTVHQRIHQGGVIERAMASGADPASILDDLYQRCLCRAPDDAERARIAEVIAAEPDRTQEVLEDVFWALLNAREFLFVH